MSYVVATDVGGTCTDTVVFRPGEPVRLGKDLSTPPHFADGVMNSISRAAESMGMTSAALLRETRLFIHGSTVVDNTLLTRTGSRTGLVTTEGFEDTLLVTRGAYGRWGGLTEERIKHPVKTDRAPALVPADRIVGVPERVDYKGAALRPLDLEAAEAAVRHLAESMKVEAIAVCFLWSFYNPLHERQIRDIVRRVAPDVYVSLSSDVAPLPGEYERTSTTVINAYAGQVTSDYLARLQSLLTEAGYDGPLLVMQGYGGLLPASEAGGRSVGMLECGPAAGVIGAKFLGDAMGDKDVIAADMGGTTFKVGVIQNGELEYAREPMVDRFHYVVPKIEVVSIGAGGGSIVRIDPRTGVPKVGPDSAGARPGPVCYGAGGTEPTLTDVMTLIGYMHPDTFLGGSRTLDIPAARRVFEEKIAGPLNRPAEEAAIGIYQIATAQITDLIREITVERGLDPRDFVLHSFGGTCGLLAGLFGEELNVRRVVVPYTASVNCAFGLISADIVHEYATTLTVPVPCAPRDVNAVFEPMMADARKALIAEGFDDDRIAYDWAVDLRYRRQVHQVTTKIAGERPLDAAGLARLIDDFEALYERKFGRGSAYREAGIEMTMFRLSARGLMARPEMRAESLGLADPGDALMGRRPIYVRGAGGLAPGDIYDFTRLRPGNVIKGPAVIHTPITTIVLHDRQIGRMDGLRNIVIEFA